MRCSDPSGTSITIRQYIWFDADISVFTAYIMLFIADNCWLRVGQVVYL